jgi:hypothetical protein
MTKTIFIITVLLILYWITYYKELTGEVSGASGIHDLYIVAKGEKGDAYDRLFNINWFTFVK